MACLEKEVDVDVELVPFSIEAGYEPKHPEVLRINPKQQVPVLIDGDLELYDSTQILEYLEARFPSPALWPSTPQAKAQARLLELEMDELFMPHVVQLFPKNRSIASSEAIDAAQTAIIAFYKQWNARLATHGQPFMARTLSYADLALLPFQFMAEVLGVGMPAELSHLGAWRSRMLARPSARPLARGWAMTQAAGLDLPAFACLDKAT